MEFRVEFVDGLLEIGAVYAVVGADCRRDDQINFAWSRIDVKINKS